MPKMLRDPDDAQIAEEMRSRLIEIFPDFGDRCELDALHDDMTVAPVHFVISCFCEYFGECARIVPQQHLKALGRLVNKVAEGSDAAENAMSTCFLEHLKQIRAYDPLSPFLSSAAKGRTRA